MKDHTVPVGAVVEVTSDKEPSYKGKRFRVVAHSRCDGEPVYDLSVEGINPGTITTGWERKDFRPVFGE